MNESRHNHWRKSPRAQRQKQYNQAFSCYLSQIFSLKRTHAYCSCDEWGSVQECRNDRHLDTQRSHQCWDQHVHRKKKNALLEHERGAMVMTIWTNSENKFSQTYFTHNLSELQQKWSETAYRGKQSTGKGLKKDNFTSNKLVSADYHPKHTEVGAFNISSAAMHHWANVFAHQYVNKILSFLKVDPQTLEETETVFEYAANIRWTNDGRDRMQISALCISRVRSLPRNIHFIQK